MVMNIRQNSGKFPGVPDDTLIGEWNIDSGSISAEWSLIVLGDLGLSGTIGLRCKKDGGSHGIFQNIAPALHKDRLRDG